MGHRLVFSQIFTTDRASLKAQVPELWKVMLATWGADDPDSQQDFQRCPFAKVGGSEVREKIHIDCTDFWAGGR